MVEAHLAGPVLERPLATRVAPQPLRFLVVDDEPTILEYVRLILEKEGHEVCTATDGLHALSSFEEKRPDIVLTDRAMPRLDGHGLAEELKRRSPDLPILLMTGFGGCVREHSGVDEVIKKPFTSDMVLAAVRRSLAMRAGASGVPSAEV